LPLPMKEDMTQLYLCEEPYWSKYDGSEVGSEAIQINVISDGTQLTKILFFVYFFFLCRNFGYGNAFDSRVYKTYICTTTTLGTINFCSLFRGSFML
jgi:hypothetical protein